MDTHSETIRAELAAKERLKSANLLSGGQAAVIVLLFAIPAAIATVKLSGSAAGDWLATWVSFEQLPQALRGRSHALMLAPLGALLVVFTRLTLGIRVLGPFRSVLLAIAFMTTGMLLGFGFFALVILVVIAVRPLLKKMKLPYFGRKGAMLAAVACMIVAATLIGLALGLKDIERVVYFPIVVLTLTGDAFAYSLRREGLKVAVWRTGATAALAMIIAACGKIAPLQQALMQFPELILVMCGLILLISKFFKLRLFEALNPAPKKKKKSRAKRLPPAPATSVQEDVAVAVP